MDNYQANQSGYGMRCSSRGLMAPVVLVTLGVLFLLSEFHVASFHRTWPILLIMIGLVRVLGGKLDTGGGVEVSAPPPPPPPPGTPAGTTQNPESREVENV